jgi:methylase of polypeptide subunit release factors
LLSGWQGEPDLAQYWRRWWRFGIGAGLLSRARFDYQGFTLELRWTPLMKRLRTSTVRNRDRTLRLDAVAGPSGFLEPTDDSLVALRDATHGRSLGSIGDEVRGLRQWLRFISLAVQERWSLAGEGFFPIRGTRTGVFGMIEIRTPAGVFRPWALSDRLAAAALASIPNRSHPLVVDVGTGSGVVALILASARADATVIGTDVSPLAVRAAKRNAVRAGLSNVRFSHSSLLRGIAEAGPVSLIVSNIPSDPPGLPRSGDDPRHALVGFSADGLDMVRQLIVQSVGVLQPGGRLVLMVRPEQWPPVRARARELGLAHVNEIESGVADFVFYVLEHVLGGDGSDGDAGLPPVR